MTEQVYNAISDVAGAELINAVAEAVNVVIDTETDMAMEALIGGEVGQDDLYLAVADSVNVVASEVADSP